MRRDLVSDHQLTGVTSPVFLIDRTIKYLPEVETEVKTPYCGGSLTAKCVEDPLYDLVFGNVDGVRRVYGPDEERNGKRPTRSEENKEEVSSRGKAEENETAEGLAMSEKKLRQDSGVLKRNGECAGALKKETSKTASS